MSLRREPTRRGTIYILVLMTSIIITLIGIIGFRLTHAQAAVVRADAERDEAMSLAESAVQWGIHYVMLADAWRENTTSGDTIRTMNLGDGTISVAIVDSDGDLADGGTEPFTIVGTGAVRGATQTLAVTLVVGEVPHPAMSRSLTAGGVLSVDKGVMTLASGGLALDQQETDMSPLNPALVDEASPVDLPDASAIIGGWSAMGTLITPDIHRGTMNFAAFSNMFASYGITPNPNGIYVVDAGGADFTLNNTLVTGTFIVTNLGTGTFYFRDSTLLPGIELNPTLIVDGPVNYSSRWAHREPQVGSIYINDNLTLSGNMALTGRLITTGYIFVDPSVGYISIFEPLLPGPTPVHFTAPGGLEVEEGSWTRVVN